LAPSYESTERELGGNERPLAIFRRRLEQAGYEDRDDLDSLGREDFRHLVTFVYKSMQLGHPAEDEDTSFEPGYEYVNLAGRGLRALPIALYVHAPTIHMLNLSMNPMIDIPRDFAEACTQLVDLKMSSMAIKKVPSALRHCAALNWLDLTCNRIRDLEDSGLEQLPGLAALSLENNRIATLPAWFPRLCALRSLNISNNKLERVPAVVCEMGGLQELDLSFNTITALPAELGQLARLRRLICVGNRIAAFPDSCRNLVCLTRLDCRRNLLRDVAPVAGLPALEELHADYNSLAELSLHVGPRLRELRVSHNDITRLVPPPAPAPHAYALGVLDLSHAKLSTLHPDALAPFGELQVLRLDHNALRVLPDTLGALTQLTQLSCSNNQLDALPDSVGRLQRLEYLEVNNNTIRHLPGALWNCASLLSFNATSNRIEVWHPWPVTDGGAVAATASPATAAPTTALVVPSDAATLRLAPSDVDILRARKGSTAGSGSLGGPADRRAFPPLSYSLERLYLGENKFDDGVCRLIWHFKELRVINLSFNDIQELPPSFFRPHKMLEQLYLSGNKLSTFPVEFLERADKLTTLFLNGNRLQTLPAELGKLTALTTLDVGSNQLKYNINNPEYDWNWYVSVQERVGCRC
jgi:adenylate cyclase